MNVTDFNGNVIETGDYVLLAHRSGEKKHKVACLEEHDCFGYVGLEVVGGVHWVRSTDVRKVHNVGPVNNLEHVISEMRRGIEEHEKLKTFRPGLYVHHSSRKLYRALALVAHHENQQPMVLYVALEYPTSLPQVREWDWGGSSWTDVVGDDGELRFQWVGP